MSELNCKNRTLFHGDNLKFLRALNSESVDLIATDPPFNKGKDFHATPDSLAAGAKFQDRWSWERDVHEEWLDQITDDHPDLMAVIQNSRKTYGDDMGAFLCFMAVRLLAMRRVLKPTGSIYLHCDPTASHYLKMIMDAVFGKKQFRNEIVWGYPASPSRSTRDFPRKHDIVLRYVISNDFVFNSDAVRVPYSEASMHRIKYAANASTVMSGTKIKLHEKGKVPPTLWSDIPQAYRKRQEATGFPTQKPLALYERMIQASSDRGGVVLDPFCGCATTLVAAERLGRQWVGIDIWQGAHEIVVDRLEREVGIFAKVTYTKDVPVRTDSGETDAPYLRVKERVKEPEGARMSRAEMYDFLLTQYGSKCQGCDRDFDDQRYLELDHNTPRADGGINHISNRILLCSPCNRLKSNTLTLSGLRRENKKQGFMR